METLLARLADAPQLLQIFILATSTLVSEDLTTIFSGMLVSEGAISPVTAVVGCFLGIFIGDGLLYLVGLVVGRPALKLPIIRNMLEEEKVDQCARWFEKNGMIVIFISRFLPGTRLPTYFAAGLVGADWRRFMTASAVAVGIWTPGLVYVSYLFGDQLIELVEQNEKYKWPIMIGGLLLMFGLVRLSLHLGNPKFRRRIYSRIRRFTDWEFWPLWIFYLPVVGYNLLMALRYFRLNIPLASNPGIDNSGYIGESKPKILRGITGHDAFVAAFGELPSGSPEERLAAALAWMKAHDVDFPVMAKPDVGQRGDGVKRVVDEADLLAYLADYPHGVHIQEMAPGPYEFGVFYRRFPNQEKGEVLGLTGKAFPRIVGNGESTIDDLIINHPDAMGRLHIYRKRFAHRLNEVLPKGEVLDLVKTGNHCLGTLFIDSSYLSTPELEARFDAISRSIDGFYIGRYDVRAADLEDFRGGKAFKIIELNGSAAEPGHMYDRRHGLWYAYKTLISMYRDIWTIGRQNIAAGFEPVSLYRLWREQQRYEREIRARAQD